MAESLTDFTTPSAQRPVDVRNSEQLKALRQQILRLHETGLRRYLNPPVLHDLGDLAQLPVIRKDRLMKLQAMWPPFGGFTLKNPSAFDHVFQSPGPIFEPGMAGVDWWRMGRFLAECGIGPGDIVQNCFSYHMTPAGMMFENGARAVGATVFPAGTEHTQLQAQAAYDLGVTAYAGTPDFLKILLDKAKDMDLKLGITKAAVSGGALFPSLRQAFSDQGIACLQCYGTADLGLVAYEVKGQDGMFIDEGVIVEIVTPGTGNPVDPGQVGEIVVTTLNPDYPLLRLATGDLSAMMVEPSGCGRTAPRIKGWMGRADQTAKVRGQFVRPSQVAALVAQTPGVERARLVITREREQDQLEVQVEAVEVDVEAVQASAKEVLKLRAVVRRLDVGGLPNDGVVIEDQRKFGEG